MAKFTRRASRTRALVALVTFSALAWAPAGAFAALTTVRATWSVDQTKHGLRVRASGPLKLRVNAAAGTFTCFCTGKARIRGTTRIEGHKVGVRGTSTIVATRCSGTLRAGALVGSVRFKQKTSAVYTVKVGGQTKRKRMGQTKPFVAKLRGHLSLGWAGSGTITDDEGVVWRWTTAQRGQTLPPPGEGKRPPDHALPPPKRVADPPPRRKLGEGKSEADHKRDLARKRNREARDRREARRRADARRQERDKGPAFEPDVPLRKQVERARSPEAKTKLVRDYVDHSRKQTDRAVRKEDATLRDAKDRKAFNKALDKDANQLGDDVQGKLDEAKQAVVDKVSDKGWQWAKSKSGTLKKAERTLDRLKQSKLGKAAGAAGQVANKVKETYDKAKAVVDEIKQVKESIDRVNRKVKSGQISKDRGKVLKGGTILGKTLSKVLGWLPVFGKTASKVTDKTFGAAMRAGEKIATHYTKTDCCINDPLADCCL